MAQIFDLTQTKGFKKSSMERLVEDSLEHHNPEVLALWTDMVKESLEKYPGVPTPATFTFRMPGNMSKDSMHYLSTQMETYMDQYVKSVKELMLEMLGDMIILQKEVAENRV